MPTGLAAGTPITGCTAEADDDVITKTAILLLIMIAAGGVTWLLLPISLLYPVAIIGSLVAFEGGGEAITALQGGHVQVYSGDASEAAQQMKAGAKIRVLAVMADKRLTGDLASVPTAKEQGFDIQWPIVRGFYVGPKVSDADYQWWSDAFKKAMGTPEYAKLRADRGLFPFDRTGADIDRYVKDQVKVYRSLAAEFGLNVTK